MSFYANDELDSMTHCPCGVIHPPAYQLSTCDHKGCGRRGCHECGRPCSNSDLCGLFCDEHLVATGSTECLCFTCVRIDFAADDLIEAEENERLAA